MSIKAIIAIIILFPWTLLILSLALLYRVVRVPRPKKMPLKAGSGAVIYTWSDWRRWAREEHPWRYYLTLVPLTFPLSEACKGLVGRRRDRKWELRNAWPNQVLRASFGVLERWVEGPGKWVLQTPPEVDDPIDADTWTRASELRALYDWWTQDRPMEMARIFNHGWEDMIDQAQAAFGLFEREQVMLTRLVNVRETMTLEKGPTP